MSATAGGGGTAQHRIAAGLAALQFLLHAIAVAGARDPRILLPHTVAWLHDVAILAVPSLAAGGMSRVCPAGARFFSAGAIAGTLAGGALLALYPQMLQSFLATPVNFLEADWGSASVFWQEYAGMGALWPLAAVLAVGGLAPRQKWLRLPGRRLLVIPAATLTTLTLLRQSPNPIVFGVQDSAQRIFAPRTVPRLKALPIKGGAVVRPVRGPRAVRAAPSPARYDHVLLLVMESVTATEFEHVFLSRPGGFFERNRKSARYFARYYATNLDSYTSLIAMTTSILVPFRAYAAPWRYERVNQDPNLARALRADGFRTLFASTYEHQPFVPNRRDWDQVTDRRHLGNPRGWTSVGTSRMEAATEDRAALPMIAQFVTSSPRSFVLAELVFGHSPQWRVKTGMTALEYYERYLTELWERLTAGGVRGRTLLIVVSDHGERAAGAQPDNYRVPLLVVADGVEPGRDELLRSHLDLEAIVAHYLRGAPMPEPRHEILLVGSTERWVYGAVRDNGTYAFIDDNTGRVLSGSMKAADLHARFQAYVGSFSSGFVHP